MNHEEKVKHLVNWLHGRGTVLLENRDSLEERRAVELDLLSVACDRKGLPIARVIAYRYLNNPHVHFVDPECVNFLKNLRESDNPKDKEVIAEAEKR